MPTDDAEILARINALVDEEHALRARHQMGQLTNDEEQARMRSVEVALDQAWDLLRQRRALRETGNNPALAEPRPADEVEGYLG